MSPIVDALRAWAPLVSSGYEVPAAGQVMLNAALEIESLRKALSDIEAYYAGKFVEGEAGYQAVIIARSVLGGAA